MARTLRNTILALTTAAAMGLGANQAQGQECKIQPGTTIVGSMVARTTNRVDRQENRTYTDWDSTRGDIEAGFSPNQSSTHLYVEGSNTGAIKIPEQHRSYVTVDTLPPSPTGQKRLRAVINLAEARKQAGNRTTIEVPLEFRAGPDCEEGVVAKTYLNFPRQATQTTAARTQTEQTQTRLPAYDAARADSLLDARIMGLKDIFREYTGEQDGRTRMLEERLDSLEEKLKRGEVTQAEVDSLQTALIKRLYEQTEQTSGQSETVRTGTIDTRDSRSERKSKGATDATENQGYLALGVLAGPERADFTPNSSNEFSIPGRTEGNFYGVGGLFGLRLNKALDLYLKGHYGNTEGTLEGKTVNPRTGERPVVELEGKDMGVEALVQGRIGGVLGAGGGVSLRRVSTTGNPLAGASVNEVSQNRFDAEVYGLLGPTRANLAVGGRYNTNGANSTPGQRNAATLFVRGTVDERLVGEVPLTLVAEAYRQEGLDDLLDYERKGLKATVLFDIVSGKALGIGLYGTGFIEEEKFGQDSKRIGGRAGLMATYRSGGRK